MITTVLQYSCWDFTVLSIWWRLYLHSRRVGKCPSVRLLKITLKWLTQRISWWFWGCFHETFRCNHHLDVVWSPRSSIISPRSNTKRRVCWNLHLRCGTSTSIHQIYCQFGISIRRSWFVVGGVPHCGPDYRNGSLKWWQYWRFEVTFSMVPMLCKCHKYYFCHFWTISKPGINMQFLKVCTSWHYWVVSALEFIKPWVVWFGGFQCWQPFCRGSPFKVYHQPGFVNLGLKCWASINISSNGAKNTLFDQYYTSISWSLNNQRRGRFWHRTCLVFHFHHESPPFLSLKTRGFWWRSISRWERIASKASCTPTWWPTRFVFFSLRGEGFCEVFSMNYMILSYFIHLLLWHYAFQLDSILDRHIFSRIGWLSWWTTIFPYFCSGFPYLSILNGWFYQAVGFFERWPWSDRPKSVASTTWGHGEGSADSLPDEHGGVAGFWTWLI